MSQPKTQTKNPKDQYESDGPEDGAESRSDKRPGFQKKICEKCRKSVESCSCKSFKYNSKNPSGTGNSSAQKNSGSGTSTKTNN